jgi:hypothetical protein
MVSGEREIGGVRVSSGGIRVIPKSCRFRIYLGFHQSDRFNIISRNVNLGLK